MNLVDRVMAEPELRASPPVLVDVGAAGGVHPAWRAIARHSIGVGFEPDARESAPLDAARGMFARWILCRTLAVPATPTGGTAELHLTASPQCSSTLRPAATALREWAFADFFRVVETRPLPAISLEAALAAEGLAHIDWLKCDTQGLDLKVYRSLPAAWRSRLLVAEFEPGIIDAYEGEDRLADVLAAMAGEPFWVAELAVGRTARGRADLIAEWLGPRALKSVRRFGPTAPAWANLRFLRDPARAAESLDRRGYLLLWVFATITGQHAEALAIATAAAARFGPSLFREMAGSSARSLRWALVCGAPSALWRRLTR